MLYILRALCLDLYAIFNRVIRFLDFFLVPYIYILDISPLLDAGKDLYHSVACCFVQMTVHFAIQKLFSFTRSHPLNVVLSACATCMLFMCCLQFLGVQD